MAGNENSGRKQEKPFRDALLLAIKDAEATKNSSRALRKIAERLLDEAANGNVQAIKEVADRLDGKVLQATSITGSNGSSLVVQLVKYADDKTSE